MILELFAVLLALSLIGVFLGYYTDDSYYAFVGLTFLFLLGIVLLSGTVEYEIGENVSLCDYNDIYVYGENYTGYHWDYASPPPSCTPNELNCVKLFHVNRTYDGCVETTTTIYDNFTGDNAHWFGFLLSVVAGLGMAGMFLQERKQRREQ